ncbi:MAG: hypothetical protein M1828_007353 [Chrysothrix sp. TS-e1954]|nr:MAG: hypothetical protein M1828_007353 [Chrysothrix sp. TS-e1954]
MSGTSWPLRRSFLWTLPHAYGRKRSVGSPILQSLRNPCRLASNTTHAARHGRNNSWKPSRRLVIGLTAAGAGTGLVLYTDSGKFIYGATTRTARVVYTLIQCINDYRKTLKQKADHELAVYDDLLKACHKRCAQRTLTAMEKNGSIFIKLGQHLSSLNYLLPSEWCDTFVPLQDHCPVSPFESIRTMVEHDTGQQFTEVFQDFEKVPLGAASLAQVHLAQDKRSGRTVAVKVQHPSLDSWAPLDLALTKFTFAQLKRAFPDYDLTWLSNEMAISLPQELDFALEGENALRARDFFKDVQGIPLIIPDVLWAKRRILVMEYVTGHRPDDLDYLDKNNISRDEVSATLARIFNTMIFARGAPLHCDPHGGNIAVKVNPSRSAPHNFDIILYDHGLYRTIPTDMQRNYAKLWLAVLDADEDNMRKYAKETANISDEDFPLFASAITGRDYRAVTSNVKNTPRSLEEKQAMSDALGEGLLQQLVHLLGKVPRIILLILKTNDLTRSLDTNLHTRQGPMRSFLILARYAAQTVFDEQVELLRKSGALLWPPRHAATLFVAWIHFTRVRLKLGLYEWYLHTRGLLGLENAAPALGA